MAKLYLFGIGGTGSRVLKSLTMLLASGVECDVETIVPIIIDKDEHNKDLEIVTELIKKYSIVNEVLRTQGGAKKCKFFNTELKFLKEGVVLPLKGDEKYFADYIDRDGMSKANMALTNALFTEDTLKSDKMDLKNGFYGNPNVGSVVLNQFDNASIFKSFASDFEDGDKIFIVSSIFGGTGASGFPLLLKLLNSSQDKYSKWNAIQKSQKGALSVLPYFNVKSKEDSLVDSGTFSNKMKAALSYYQSLDKQIDALYYIGDEKKTEYEHHEGGQDQCNKAHFVEFASALAILDFVNLNPETRNDDNEITQTIYKEFGIQPDNKTEKNGDTITLLDLASGFKETKELVRTPLIQFFLFRSYLKDVFDKENKYQPYARNYPWKKDQNFDSDFRNISEIKQLESIQDLFFTWLYEMTEQEHKFIPLKLENSKSDVFDFVSDIKVSKVGSWRFKDWAWMDNELNRQIENVSKSLGKSGKFIELFYLATGQFVKKIANNTGTSNL